MRASLARMAAVLRAATVAVAVVAAIVGAVPPVSWAWLGPALAVLLAWTPVYVAVAWTRGLRPWLIGADLALAAALGLAIGHLVPAAALAGTASWVDIITYMTVVSAQLAGSPLLSVPAGLLAVAAFVAGQRLAGSADGGLTALTALTVQVLVGAAVMAVAMRVERTAVRAFDGLQEAQAAAALALARREDERAQLRMVHNGPLTTLTMALHAGPAGRPTVTLQRRAAAVLAALPALGVGAAAVGGTGGGTGNGGGAAEAPARLDQRLAQVVAWYTPSLRVTANLREALVPALVAEAIAAAASEAFGNIVGHAGTDAAFLDLTVDADAVRVTVVDHGRGFDPAAAPAPGHGFGLREDLAGRMDAVGGRATVRSSPGRGTTVELTWHRG
jgi:signal transduction histidine kinase